MIIRDRIALGTFAGIAATVPALIVNFLSVQLGLAKWYSFQLSAGIYLHPGLTDSIQGMFLGAFVWMIPAAFMGVIVSYIISATGEDYWWLKGIGVTLVLMYLFIYGFLFTLGAAEIIPFDFATNMSVYVENVIYGVAVGYLVVRWGCVSKP